MTILSIKAYLKKRKYFFVITFVFTFVVGCLLGLLPPVYKVDGLFFVSLPAQPIPSDFSYEGYYSQKNADQFSYTLIGLLESRVFSNQVSQSFKSFFSTKQLRRHLSIYRAGPQLVGIHFKHKDKELALKVWDSISSQVLSISKDLSHQTGSDLMVSPVWQAPVVEVAIIPWWVGGLLGAFSFLFLSAAVLLVKGLFDDKKLTI